MSDLPFKITEGIEYENTMEDVVKILKECTTHIDFLVAVKNTVGLCMLNDNGWYWLEYDGIKVPNSEKERFTKSSEMDDLLMIAGL